MHFPFFLSRIVFEAKPSYGSMFIYGRPSRTDWTPSTVSRDASSCGEVAAPHAAGTRKHPRDRPRLEDYDDELFQVKRMKNNNALQNASFILVCSIAIRLFFFSAYSLHYLIR